MDRAGYCFSSMLGQTLFDNSNCTGQQVNLAPVDANAVTELRALEARIGCRVDTSRQWINLSDINFRRVLTNSPVLDELQGKCLRWLGPVTPLYAGHQEPFVAIGQIQAGDGVGLNHLPVGDWAYVTAHYPGSDGLKSAGWLYWPDRFPCSEMIP